MSNPPAPASDVIECRCSNASNRDMSSLEQLFLGSAAVKYFFSITIVNSRGLVWTPSRCVWSSLKYCAFSVPAAQRSNVPSAKPESEFY